MTSAIGGICSPLPKRLAEWMGSPDVWQRTRLTVAPEASPTMAVIGADPRYSLIGVSRSTLCWSTNSNTPVAVYGFVNDASAYIVSGVAGIIFLLFAQPNDSFQTIFPFLATATLTEGNCFSASVF